MNIEKTLNDIEKEVVEIFKTDSSGHDIHHLKRTKNLALHIQKTEGGNREIIAIAAMVHDIHRILSKKGEYCAPKQSLPTVQKVLEKVDLDFDKIKKVLHCVEFHEEYGFTPKGKTVEDIETLILQDADNLDAIGAIGIGRCFSFCGANGIPMWVPEIPFEKKDFDESIYDPSALHHFHSKLLKLKDNMNTETGKQMALERHEFIERFIKEFISEWKGEK